MPKVSVIIPTYNRKGFLKLALLAYNHQDYKNFDVIVCSDGASDGSKEMVGELREQLNYEVKFLEQEDLGYRRSLALNRGIDESKADYIIFADDDSIPPTFYVSSHVKKLAPGIVVAAKHMMIKTKKKKSLFSEENIMNKVYMKACTLLDRLDLLAWKIKYHTYFLQKHPLRPKLRGSNFSVSRKDLCSINGFDCDFIGWGYEDNDIRRRLLTSGVKMREAVFKGFNFNLGDTKNATPRQTTFERIQEQKRMSMDKNRPLFCERGLNCVEQE